MKTFKYSGVLVLLLAFNTMVYAQSREKIKGNRDVTIKQTYLNDFNTLIVKDNFEVKLAYNSKPSIEIETDENLHDVIDKDVSSGVLTISTSRRITSKKKLEITVYYGDSLRNIQLQNSAEVRSLTSLELDDLELKTDETTRVYLNVKSKMFKFTGNGRSKSRLNITADSTSFVMSDNSRLDALINGKSSTFDMYQSADAKIEGDVENSVFRLDNSSKFSGKNYTIINADVLIESNSDATLFVETLLNLRASGSSAVYLYGEPKITLKTFTNTTKLQKKDINAKGLF